MIDLQLALKDLNPLWFDLLQKEFTKTYFLDLQKKLLNISDEIFPLQNNLFTAYNLINPCDVKVLILGQDPYHGMNQAHGLAFSVEKESKTPPSLRNIFKELSEDLDKPIRTNTNLSDWAEQGVFLLNTVLTVSAHKANSHAKMGWEEFTKASIDIVNQNFENIVFVFWGAHAQKYRKYIDESKHLVLCSAHPSPLSVYRGFWGSKPFSQINNYLLSHGKTPINWNK